MSDDIFTLDYVKHTLQQILKAKKESDSKGLLMYFVLHNTVFYKYEHRLNKISAEFSLTSYAQITKPYLNDNDDWPSC